MRLVSKTSQIQSISVNDFSLIILSWCRTLCRKMQKNCVCLCITPELNYALTRSYNNESILFPDLNSKITAIGRNEYAGRKCKATYIYIYIYADERKISKLRTENRQFLKGPYYCYSKCQNRKSRQLSNTFTKSILLTFAFIDISQQLFKINTFVFFWIFNFTNSPIVRLTVARRTVEWKIVYSEVHTALFTAVRRTLSSSPSAFYIFDFFCHYWCGWTYYIRPRVDIA